MNDQVAGHPDGLANELVSGEIDDAILRQFSALNTADTDPKLESVMLTALSDTPDGRLRNILAMTLAKLQSPEAIPRILALLHDPKTYGYRSSLLYALEKLNVTLSLTYLVSLILFDTPEVQEEAFLLLERAIATASRQDRSAALSLMLDGPTAGTDGTMSDVALDAASLLAESTA